VTKIGKQNNNYVFVVKLDACKKLLEFEDHKILCFQFFELLILQAYYNTTTTT